MSARDTSGSAPQHSHPHISTMSRNEKFWVDQVTVPQPPPPPRGTTRGGERQRGGGVLQVSNTTCSTETGDPRSTFRQREHTHGTRILPHPADAVRGCCRGSRSLPGSPAGSHSVRAQTAGTPPPTAQGRACCTQPQSPQPANTQPQSLPSPRTPRDGSRRAGSGAAVSLLQEQHSLSGLC